MGRYSIKVWSILDVSSWRNVKIRLCKTGILHKNLESAEFTYNKYGKPTLHSLTANHVIEMSVKVRFKWVRFKKKHCFALVVLNRSPICFYQGLFTRCDLYHRILLCYHAEIKEMIQESVNLKGVVYEPKQTLSDVSLLPQVQVL